jgi:ribosomal protein S27E
VSRATVIITYIAPRALISKRINHCHKDSTYAVKLIRTMSLPVTLLSPVQCAKCRKSKCIQPVFPVQDTFVNCLFSSNTVSSPSFLKVCRLTSLFLEWIKSHFLGLFCNHCKYFAICWRCIGAAKKVASFELISGLHHRTSAGSSNISTASDWLLVYEPAQGVISA